MNNGNPLVSVIVPVYNVEKYLSKCIDSILRQSYKNIEIILVNDGSTDNCGKICLEYEHIDDRVRVVTQENAGLSAARNTGISVAKGHFLAFIDSDDWIHFQFVEMLMRCQGQYDADIVMCDYISVEECDISYYSDLAQKSIADFDIWNDCVISDARKYVHDMLEINSIKNTVAWNKIYRKNLFDDIKYPAGRINEDEFTTYRLIGSADKVAVIDEKLYYYYQRENSIMGSPFNIRRFDLLDAKRAQALYSTNNHLKADNAIIGYIVCMKKNIKKGRVLKILSKVQEREWIKRFHNDIRSLTKELSSVGVIKLYSQLFVPGLYNWLKSNKNMLKFNKVR